MQTIILLPLAMLVAIVQSQIPSFGACPELPAVKNFEREKFFGTWYEIERYFTVSEVGTKCVTATYERRPDGKIYINNAYTNRFTGVQRIISGQMKLTGKTENEGLYNVIYSAVPAAFDTTLKVLETDYETFAVIWSCSSVGPFGHTESVWVMGREREPAGVVLQRIYGVLDKFKINRTFFVQSDQKDCDTLPPPIEAIDPTPTPPIKTTANKKKKTDKIKLEIIPNTEAAKASDTDDAIEDEVNVVPVNQLKTEIIQTVEIVDTPPTKLRSQPIEEYSLPARLIQAESETDVSKIETFAPANKFVQPSKEDEGDIIKDSVSPVAALKTGIDREIIADAAKEPIKDAIETVESVKSTVSVETKKPVVTKKLISTRRIGEKTEKIQQIPVVVVGS